MTAATKKKKKPGQGMATVAVSHRSAVLLPALQRYAGAKLCMSGNIKKQIL